MTLGDVTLVSDVDVAMDSGLIYLIGDGNKRLCDLPGDKASELRDMLTDMIFERIGEPIEEIESREGWSVCRACGSVSIELDPPIEILPARQCHAVLAQPEETSASAERCMLTSGHEGQHWVEMDPLTWD